MLTAHTTIDCNYTERFLLLPFFWSETSRDGIRSSFGKLPPLPPSLSSCVRDGEETVSRIQGPPSRFCFKIEDNKEEKGGGRCSRFRLIAISSELIGGGSPPAELFVIVYYFLPFFL